MRWTVHGERQIYSKLVGQFVEEQVQQADQAAAADDLAAVDHRADLRERDPLDPVRFVRLREDYATI